MGRVGGGGHVMGAGDGGEIVWGRSPRSLIGGMT